MVKSKITATLPAPFGKMRASGIHFSRTCCEKNFFLCPGPTVHPNVHPNVHRNVHLGWTLRWTLGWTVGWTVHGLPDRTSPKPSLGTPIELPIFVADFRPPKNAPRRRHRKFCTKMRERGSRQHSSSRRCQTCVHRLHSNAGGGLQGGSEVASCLNKIPCFGKKYLVFGPVFFFFWR